MTNFVLGTWEFIPAGYLNKMTYLVVCHLIEIDMAQLMSSRTSFCMSCLRSHVCGDIRWDLVVHRERINEC
jgi:hypothetical protein